MLSLRSDIKAVLTAIKSIKVRFSPHEWEMIRAYYEQYSPLAGAKEVVFAVADRQLDLADRTVPVRIYRPTEGRLPVLVYFHGGWFSAGSLDTHDTPLRKLANMTGVLIVAVDYRLAPEHPFPAGLNDCVGVVDWVCAHARELGVRAEALSVGGDSAGGALAALVSRRRSEAVRGQVLIYPSTDNRHDTDSWQRYRHGPLITLKGGKKAWNWYMPEQDMRDRADAAPLRNADLSGMPATFMAIAEHDPLKDEEVAYTQRLMEQGGSVTRLIYKDMIHGFFQMGAYLKETDVLMHDIQEFLTELNAD